MCGTRLAPSLSSEGTSTTSSRPAGSTSILSGCDDRAGGRANWKVLPQDPDESPPSQHGEGPRELAERGGGLIFAGIAAEIALIVLIVYTPWGNGLIGAAPLSSATWLFFILFGLGLFALEEFRKLIVPHAIPPGSVANDQAKLAWTKPGESRRVAGAQ